MCYSNGDSLGTCCSGVCDNMVMDSMEDGLCHMTMSYYYQQVVENSSDSPSEDVSTTLAPVETPAAATTVQSSETAPSKQKIIFMFIPGVAFHVEEVINATESYFFRDWKILQRVMYVPILTLVLLLTTVYS